MQILQKFQLKQNSITKILKQNRKQYGDKLIQFSTQLPHMFDSFRQCRFKEDDQKISKMALCIFMGILLKKWKRSQQDPSFNRKLFLQQIRQRSEQLVQSNKLNLKTKIPTLEEFQNFIAHAINDINGVFFTKSIMTFMSELILWISKKKDRDNSITNEQINRINISLKQNVYFINYDAEKNCLKDKKLVINHDYLYILKCKQMYFILGKQQQITLIQSGQMTHQELAQIFKVEDKLQTTILKQSIVKSTSQILKSNHSIKEDQNKILSPSKSIIHNQLNNSYHNINTTSVSLIKSTILFPQNVKCTLCARMVSQFCALYWNYNSYCIQCIVNPKIDVSFIPPYNIQKFIITQKFDCSNYTLVCPQCESIVKLSKYKPWQKQKSFTCSVCQKHICIQHSKIIQDCFCFCSKCNKHTISIQSQFIKYCQVCRRRSCELCSTIQVQLCNCMCEKCRCSKLIDHECKQICYKCKGSNLILRDDIKNRKVCNFCFFQNIQDNKLLVE